MSATGGFWPGEAPAAEQDDGQEPEAEAVEPLDWPQPHEQEAEPEAEQAAVAVPAAEAEEVPEVAPAGHAPGELDIPDGVAILEGSPSGADRTVGVVVSRFNGEISNLLLEAALETLAAGGRVGDAVR